MENATRDVPPPALMHADGRWTGSAVVGTVVGRLAHEFPELPVGLIIAASVRSLHELRRVPLTTLVDAPFDGVRELVEEQSRRALRDSDALRVPRQRKQMLRAMTPRATRLFPSPVSSATRNRRTGLGP